jgi:hypothetical protein
MEPSILKKEILKQIDTLSFDLQRKVLEFIYTLNNKLPKGVAGKKLLRFAGSISQDDLQAMKEAIENGCEQIDVHEW